MWLTAILFWLTISAIATTSIGTAWSVVPQDVEIIDGYGVANHVPLDLEGRESVLETHSISGRGFVKAVRNKRTPTYHIIESPVLRSHFEFNDIALKDNTNEHHFKGSGFWSNINKRSLDDVDVSAHFTENYAIARLKPRTKRDASEEADKEEASAAETAAEKQSARQSRGTSHEQWLKQPLPVEYPTFEDQETSAAINEGIAARAPRVNFITNKKLDTSESRDERESVQRSHVAPYKPYELRTDIYPYNGRALERTSYAASSNYPEYRRNYYEDRPYHNDYRRQNDDYYKYDRNYDTKNRYNNDYDPYSRSQPSQNRQRRIIYYATLPDVVRSPPNVNLRDRSYGPNSHDDRKYENYDYESRAPYYRRSRFEPPTHYRPRDMLQADGTNPPENYNDKNNQVRDTGNQTPLSTLYPVKISTSLNVKENDKVPEHRIFAENLGKSYEYSQPPSFQEVIDESPGSYAHNNRRN